MSAKGKQTRSKYDAHAAQLDEWFEGENATLDEAVRRLNANDPELKAERSGLAKWWQRRLERKNATCWIEAIAEASGHCERVQNELDKNPAPQVELLMKLHHVLILSQVVTGRPNEEALKRMTPHLKPVVQWAQLQEKQKGRALEERKFEESLRTKLEAGFELLAKHIKDDAAAREAFESLKATAAVED